MTAGGIPVRAVAIVLGYGANYLSAFHVDGRLVLNNGSHRAYALRAEGIELAPCLIREVSRREELELHVQGEILDRTDAYLTAPRPPVLKDYFDERLRAIFHVPRKVRQVRVGLNAEQLDVPAA
jgi:hypothetical protein